MDLVQAARSGNIQGIRELLDRGANPNIKDDYGTTALMVASIKDRVEIVELLLNRGAVPDIQDDDGDTALTLASEFGRTEIVRLLLDRGADPNIRDRYGNTALIKASYRGHTEIVRLLLDHGANPNIINNRGNTALMIAERLGQDDVARLIRDHIHLQKARQDLALVSFFNPRLGMDSPLNYLDESDIIKEITSKPRRYDPNINIRMMNERRRDISRIRHIPSVQTRLMLEDRQPIVQQTQLESDDIDWDEIFKEHPELRTEQSGRGFSKRSSSGKSNRRKRTRKRLYK